MENKRFIEDINVILQTVEKKSYSKSIHETTEDLVKNFPELSFLVHRDEIHCSNQTYFDSNSVEKLRRHIGNFDHILTVSVKGSIIGFVLMEDSNIVTSTGHYPALHITGICANYGFKVDETILDFIDVFAMTMGVKKVFRYMQKNIDYWTQAEVYTKKGYVEEQNSNDLRFNDLIVLKKCLETSPVVAGLKKESSAKKFVREEGEESRSINIGDLFPLMEESSGNFH